MVLLSSWNFSSISFVTVIFWVTSKAEMLHKFHLSSINHILEMNFNLKSVPVSYEVNEHEAERVRKAKPKRNWRTIFRQLLAVLLVLLTSTSTQISLITFNYWFIADCSIKTIIQHALCVIILMEAMNSLSVLLLFIIQRQLLILSLYTYDTFWQLI